MLCFGSADWSSCCSASLFAGALVTITFNTIRLQILAQAAEIEVARLVGATDSYIQRPLHYFGMLQGALGGLCAAAPGGRRFPVC
jgi:cell division transport system permease protein